MNLENNKIKAPFTVPQAYFEGLEDRLLSEISISELSKLKVNRVPEGYFDTFEEQVISQIKLSSFKKEMPVSENYFDEMESQILSRIKIDGLSQPKVEEAYFSSLEGNILAEINLSKLKQPAVSEGYFDSLEDKILSKTVEEKKPTFTLFKNIKVWRGAAAAAIVGLAAYMTVEMTTPKDDLATISSEAMIAYLAEQPLMDDDLSFVLDDGADVLLTTDISEADISEYLDSNGI